MSETPRPLFAYGTFRSPVWRRLILAHEYAARPAVLSGWRRVTHASTGYLTIEERPFEIVEGVLLDLDAYGWRVADAWEDTPAYVTVDVEVKTVEGLVPAQAYVATNAPGFRETIDDRALAALPDDQVERAIRAFRAANRWIRGRWELLLYRDGTYVGGRRYESERDADETGRSLVGAAPTAAAAPDDLLRAIVPPPDRYVVRLDADPSRPA